MTSIDFREMMKKARAEAKSRPTNVQAEMELTKEIKMTDTQKDAEGANNYTLESFHYNMEEEIASFHSMFEKWKVGSIDHVYYIPNFITEEEESFLLSNVRLFAFPF